MQMYVESPGAAPGYIDRGAEYIRARERVSARIYGWGPGAALGPLAGVLGAEPPEALGF